MLTKITFENLPEAVQEVNYRLERLEKILLNKAEKELNDLDRRMNIKEAAEFINCAVPTVYGLVFHRTIPHEKKGKRLYFLKSELVEWLKKGKRLTVDEIKSRT